MKELFIVLLLAASANAQTCNIGTANGPISDYCITDVPPNPGKPRPAPPYGRPLSTVIEPTTSSVVAEPAVAPDPTRKRKIKQIKAEIAKYRARIRKLEREIRSLGR